MKRFLVFGSCLAIVVLSSQPAMAVDEDDVTPDYAFFRESGQSDQYIYESDFTDGGSCEGGGFCNKFHFDPRDMDPNHDSTDGWLFRYDVVGTLPSDYDSFYWDLDSASPGWVPAQYHTKGTNWAQTSQYLDVDDWDYEVNCGVPVNRIEWDYDWYYNGFIFVYTMKAVETEAWPYCVV